MSHERSHIPPKGDTSGVPPPITIKQDGGAIQIILPTFHEVNTDMSINLSGDGGASVSSSSKPVPTEGTPATSSSKITSIVLAGFQQQVGTGGTVTFIPIPGQTLTVNIFFNHY